MSTGHEIKKYRTLSTFWKLSFVVLSSIGIILTILQIFNLKILGITIMSNGFLYVLLLIYLSFIFIVYPATSKASRSKVPFYDLLLFAVTFICFSYFAVNSIQIITKGWELTAPIVPTTLSIITWLIVMEALRRAGGLPLTIICAFFSVYPLFANYMPGFLQGQSFSLFETARYHIMSNEAILGIPMATFGSLIIGFIVFGSALQVTGGGEFFIRFASSLFGRSRGGTAKVAIFSSALFGTMSGSAISNVLTIGSLTIPAMKKAGYPSEYAAAVEACSSTGGILMPPVMGAVAFVMASFIGLPYSQICIAAAIPSVLYFLGIFLQVDAYAAVNGFKGSPNNEIVPIKQALKEGWYYIFSFVVLVYLLLYLKQEAQAPFYSTAVLLVLSLATKKGRGNFNFPNFSVNIGTTLIELVAILAGIGFIIGPLSITGVANSFANEIVALAGGNTLGLLILGAVTSFIMGMGMTVTACYVFLAILLAPALAQSGLNLIGIHLFVLYWGMLSYITPPVALAAYVAAGLAEANPIRVGYRAMRLAAIIYILPFFFVYEPALIFQAPLNEVLFAFVTAIVGMILFTASFEGFLLFFGKINKIFIRVILFFCGLLLVYPGWRTDLVGILIASLAVFVNLLMARKEKRPGYGS